MIRHNILFKAKSNVTNEEIQSAIDLFLSHERGLKGVFSIIGDECHFHDEKSTHFFMNNITRGVSHCLSIDFVDRKALDEFFNDQSLYAAKKAIVDIAENGWDGILAFDLENPEI